MWKIYASNNAGIAITSTFDHLKKCFNKVKEPIYIGKVKYIKYETEAIEESNYLNFFVHKRKFFSYENELRVLTQVRVERYTKCGEPTEVTVAYTTKPVIGYDFSKLA
jgi:Protein of unknown function (DUF2971)